MKPLYKRYEHEEPAGVYQAGYCGYLFFEPLEEDRWSCDYVVCFTGHNGYRGEYRRHRVSYGGHEWRRPHIRRDGARLYLDDVLRVH